MVPRRAIVPIAAGLLAAGTATFPLRNVYAETSEALSSSSSSSSTSSSSSSKKPIYDDDPSNKKSNPPPPPPPPPPQPSPNPATSTGPTHDSSESRSTPSPTDLLAQQIRRTRLFVHAHAVAAEDRLNELMSSFLDLETSFTNTVASLAPPKESGEQIMPGLIYVLVASMAGSIVSRNRNILLRGTVPLAVGIGAGWLFLPITTRNVADLLWRFEQKAPVVSETHLRIRRAVDETWRRARETGRSTIRAVDRTVQGGRDGLEEWVRKGK
ncbi:MAG: hypothetical protein M1816_002159 [Peltula sp. TS41687]|nr:MAG: hypothetical protein M1816_002159 [Peltula sp. TS41687]